MTGGTGFIGSALVKSLLSSNHEVIVFDDNSRGSINKLKGYSDRITIINGDVRKPEEVARAAEDCDNIFHLAFINGTRFFYEKPDLVLDVGIKGAFSTIESAKNNKINTYVLASSSEVYQTPKNIPTNETERAIIPDIINPRYSYAGGKLISELLAINLLRDTNVRTLIFRPHNVFGPDMGFEHVIPELMKKLFVNTDGWSKKECRIKLQGDGNESRSFCYIDDAINQIMVMFNNGENRNIYHIGMDKEITINHLVQDIAKILEIKIKIDTGEKPIGGTSRRCPNIEKIKSIGYNKIDNYHKGLKKTINWYKNYYANNE